MKEGFDLITTHNGHGFFSCITVTMNQIIEHYNRTKKFPVVDFSECFSLYKDSKDDDIYNMIFEEDPSVQFCSEGDVAANLGIGGNYEKILKDDIDNLTPFIDRYFRVSRLIKKRSESWKRNIK